MEHSNEIVGTSLLNALECNEFHLYYQPKLDLISGKVSGVEALIRWKHPTKGVVSPLEFIPIAEKTGLILPIGDWILRKACEQSKIWQDIGLPPKSIAVNLSVLQLYQPNLAERIQLILYETGLAPEYLELEITESMMMDVQRVLPIIKELKQIGVQISLDDFGTGYSSLYYLKEMPITKIKIDQSFVRNCTVDTKDATIVKTIIAMAHQLNIKVVAEGIESKDQLIFLQQNFCNQGQGYLFSKPLPPDELKTQFHKIERIIKREGISPRIYTQKWLKKALENVRQELRETVRQQQGMIFKFTERNGKFVHTLCDGELLYRMGFTPERIVGKELHDFLSYFDAEEKLQYYRRAWNGEENVTFEREENGIWYFASLRPIRRGGQVVEVIASCVDITEKKLIMEALRQNEEKYRLIAENMQDLISILDIDGVVQYASPSHKTILGFSPEVYEGHFVFELVHPDEIPEIQMQFKNMVTLKTSSRVEFRFKHAQGNWVYMEALGTPVLDETDNITHIVVVARDISERKKTEEFIQKSEKISIVGKMAAAVAHEIRNPLTSIKGFTQLLKKNVANSFYTDMILSEIRRMENIIGGFLSLTKPQNPQKREVDVRTLLQEVLLIFGTQALLNNVEIVLEYDGDFTHIYCDENQIKQVFMNILQNAMESMPNGGILKVLIHWENLNCIRFQFVDEGYGISEERFKYIGEPFFSTKEKGTGLGLMLSHRIIHEHGGTISIESNVHQGTTVTVVLPIKHLVSNKN